MTRFPTEAFMCCSVAVLLRQCRIGRLLQVFDLLEVVRFGDPGLELPQCTSGRLSNKNVDLHIYLHREIQINPPFVRCEITPGC
jgi:hypothetical protein